MGTNDTQAAFYIGTKRRFPTRETGPCFLVNGITVNKTIQTVESAASGSAFLIEDVYPSIDGGRFAVKRIAGERVEVWADVYRDGDDVVSAALIWRGEQERDAWATGRAFPVPRDERPWDLEPLLSLPS